MSTATVAGLLLQQAIVLFVLKSRAWFSSSTIRQPPCPTSWTSSRPAPFFFDNVEYGQAAVFVNTVCARRQDFGNNYLLKYCISSLSSSSSLHLNSDDALSGSDSMYCLGLVYDTISPPRAWNLNFLAQCMFIFKIMDISGTEAVVGAVSVGQISPNTLTLVRRFVTSNKSG